MKYVILTIQWCLDRGISIPTHARKSLNGERVILHLDFIDPVLIKEDEIESYEHDSSSLKDILSSEEWSEPDEKLEV